MVATINGHVFQYLEAGRNNQAQVLSFYLQPLADKVDEFSKNLIAVCAQINEFLASRKSSVHHKYGLVDYWITTAENGARVVLNFQLPDSKLLDEGTFKKIYPSETWEIDTKLQESPISYFSVRVCLIPKEDDNSEKLLANGRENHKKLWERFLDEKSNGVFLVSPPRQYDKTTFTQERYSCDLFDAIKCRSKVKFKFWEILKCLKDVALTADWLHTQGMAHSDIKRENIFVKRESPSDESGEERPIGYLADFDFAHPFGYYSLLGESDFVCWDPCVVNGKQIVTPYVDRYGIVLVLVLIVHGEQKLAYWKGIRNKIIEKIETFTFLGPEGVCDDDMETWSDMRKKSFCLFCDLCAESAHASLSLESLGDRPTAEDVENIMQRQECTMGKVIELIDVVIDLYRKKGL